jgi:hypothetical protein
MTTMLVPVVPMTERARPTAMTLARPLPSMACARKGSTDAEFAWSLLGDTTPCRPTTEIV